MGFYDIDEEKEWKFLDIKGFDVNSAGTKRLSYENLSRLWKNIIQHTDPPFTFFDIDEQELQVWTYYAPRDLSFNKTKKERLEDGVMESLLWIFHLKNPVKKWLAYDVLAEKDNWFEISNSKGSIDDKTCQPVPFEVLKREWERLFGKPKTQTPFQMEDILEK